MGTAAFVALLMGLCNQQFSATQFALFTSLAAVPRTFANAATGFMVETMGWFNFYMLCFALAVPGMVLLIKIAPWNEIKPSLK